MLVDDMLARYGEAVTRIRAGEILGRSRSTIAVMIKDGRLSECCAGTMISVRSIAAYLDQPRRADYVARLTRRRAASGTRCRWSV